MFSIQKWFYIWLVSIIFGIYGCLYAYASDLYIYSVRPGDTLSEITLMFAGNLNYFKVAQENNITNPDLIYPGNKVRLSSSRPVSTLRKYLKSIYDNKPETAYKLLSKDTRSKFRYDEFNKSINSLTFYDLFSLTVCSDFYLNSNHILQIKAQLAEDPASWGFNLIREEYKWYILLYDLDPTAPRDDELIKWLCY